MLNTIKKLHQKLYKKGFTLLELLVVVLIIGILAAIALPQYQTVKEKAIMTEGIKLVKHIAEANQRYYLVNGDYANDIQNLDIEFSGTPTTHYDINRIETGNFVISATGYGGTLQNPLIAVAQEKSLAKYYVQISAQNPNIVKCGHYGGATQIQKNLCTKINNKGYL